MELTNSQVSKLTENLKKKSLTELLHFFAEHESKDNSWKFEGKSFVANELQRRLNQ
jgi:hypothetical protein